MRIILLGALAAALTAQQFESPFRIKTQAGFADADTGHAAPYLFDIDGDGQRNLLVGQFGEGKLRIYRNTGTDAKPDYAAHTFFEAGGTVATTPAG